MREIWVSYLPVTETESSAEALLSTVMWNLATWLTGINSKLLKFTDTLLVSDTEHTNGQPEQKNVLLILRVLRI